MFYNNSLCLFGKNHIKKIRKKKGERGRTDRKEGGETYRQDQEKNLLQ